MKFFDLPLNVPVLVSDQEVEWELIRMNDSEAFVTNSGTNWSGTSYSPNTWSADYYTIIDQPTDEDAAQIGVFRNESTQSSLDQDTLFQAGLACMRSFNYNSAVPSLRSQGICDANYIAPQNIYSYEYVVAPAKDSTCTCPLYGASGLLAVGCKCGGK